MGENTFDMGTLENLINAASCGASIQSDTTRKGKSYSLRGVKLQPIISPQIFDILHVRRYPYLQAGVHLSTRILRQQT